MRKHNDARAADAVWQKLIVGASRLGRKRGIFVLVANEIEEEDLP
jgi:hypothetical protein